MGKKKAKKTPPTEVSPVYLERLTEMYGEDVCRDIENVMMARPTTLRVNHIKGDGQAAIETLRADGFELEAVSWYADAYILRNKSKRELIDHPVYEAGQIYVQSLESMVPPLFVDTQPGESVLDLTAAPGSKTSQMAMMMGKQGRLVANDVNTVRFYKLRHNMQLLGVTDEASDWQFELERLPGTEYCRRNNETFDKILLDAPCGSEARFAKDRPKSFGYWSERKIKEMAYKQRKLILEAWNALKPGGTLVYSTCTMAPEENEAQISLLLSRNEDVEVVPISIDGLDQLPSVTEWRSKQYDERVKDTLRIMPTSDIEGFFVAKLKKSV